MDKIDIRAKLHNVIGHLRRNELIDAYDLVLRMSQQMDNDYYSQQEHCFHLSRDMGGKCFKCGKATA